MHQVRHASEFGSPMHRLGIYFRLQAGHCCSRAALQSSHPHLYTRSLRW
jgi:hypothetical protein